MRGRNQKSISRFVATVTGRQHVKTESRFLMIYPSKPGMALWWVVDNLNKSSLLFPLKLNLYSGHGEWNERHSACTSQHTFCSALNIAGSCYTKLTWGQSSASPFLTWLQANRSLLQDECVLTTHLQLVQSFMATVPLHSCISPWCSSYTFIYIIFLM